MLFLVPTPIGNLADITLRALETLRNADVIACEDTRHSLRLLDHHGIRKPLVSYHEHNEARRAAELLERIRKGENIAIITDAGMPGISDPGHRLLRACIEEKLPYTVLPGASALLTGLIGSGFPADEFHYGGFLPVKSGGREREIAAAGARAETSVYFESPHRLLRTLEACARLCPERRLCVARELSKQFEEFRAGTGAELVEHFTAHPPRGEMVLVVCALTKEERREIQRAE